MLTFTIIINAENESQRMNHGQIKKSLLQICLDKVNAHISAIETNIESIVESRDNETKSSVGDKYETGRAMMQIEYQKAQGQLLLAQNTKAQIMGVNLERSDDVVGPGNLVVTSNGNYFISIGMGKLTYEDELYYCISLASPMGQLLKNKSVGDHIAFNGKNIHIEKIA